MTDVQPFLGEIGIVAFGYPPKGWAFCNGQVLAISQNQALFSLLGTTYGGNGQTTFALPDLRDRVPMHLGDGHNLGERSGESAHTLSTNEIPAHIHLVNASGSNGDVAVPTGAALGAASGLYAPPSGLTSLNPTSVTNVGGSQPHNNMQPYLSLHFVIALQGIFPSVN
jgi:microcystin-dependent protein